MSNTRIIDPRDFIQKPFTDCPFCKKKTFGVLSVQNNNFIKRCKECFKSERFYLPEIRKKVIYLDQFVISNLMIVKNKNLEAYKRLYDKEFWMELDFKLTKAIRKQLVVCPSSSFHKSESSLSKYQEMLEHSVTHISTGISFYPKRDILLQQIEVDIENWITGKNKDFSLKPENISRDKLHEWQGNYFINVDYKLTDDWINEFLNEKEKSSSILSKNFKEWQELTEFDFDEYYNSSLLEFGRAYFFDGKEHYRKLALLEMDPINSGIDPTIMTRVPFLTQLMEIFEYNFNSELGVDKLTEYLLSNRPIKIPYNNLFSILITSLAKKAFEGQKKIPNQGTMHDKELVSCYLPYCDVMILDKKIHSLLIENPSAKYINYDTELFSLSNKNSIISYLDSILNNISFTHQHFLEMLYGNPEA